MGRVEVEVEVERAREWQERVGLDELFDTAITSRDSGIGLPLTKCYEQAARGVPTVNKGASDARGRARSATRRRARDAALAPPRWTTNVCARCARPGAGRFAPRDASPRATRHPAPASSRSPATRRPALIRAPPPPPASPLAPHPPQLDAFRRAKARRAAESAEAAAAKPPARPVAAAARVPPRRRRAASRSRLPRGVRRRVAAAAPRAPRAPRDERRRRARGRHLLRPRHARGARDRARDKAALRAENASLREDVARLEDLVDGLARLLEASGADSSGPTPEKKREKRRLGIDRSEQPRRRAETRGGDGAGGTVAIGARARASGARLPAEDAVLAEDASSDPFAEFDAFLTRRRGDEFL